MMAMRIRRPLLAFFVFLALLTAGGLYIASQSDAHGWHYTKCRNGARWIRGHTSGYWYGPWYNCTGYWTLWENYINTTKVWP